MSRPSRYVNSTEAAEIIGISRQLLHELRCEGSISPACVMPTFYERAEVERYAEDCGQQRTYDIDGELITVVYDDRSAS